MKIWGALLISIVLILSACDADNSTQAIPTRVQIGEEAPPLGEGEAPPLAESTALTDSERPTLPPTWTPTVPALPTPTREAAVAQAQSVAPTDTGSIFFIYNNDSIILVDPDTPAQGSQIIITFGVGQPISQLTPSPNGEFLAFVGVNEGNPPEVWVSDRTGISLRQITCLGFDTIKHIAWHPDNERLLVTASPTPDGAATVYTVTIANSRRCPENQQALIERNSPNLNEAVYNDDGSRIYFLDHSLFAWDVASNQTSATVYQNDRSDALYNLQYVPQTEELVSFMFPTFENLQQSDTGAVFIADASDLTAPTLAYRETSENSAYTWRNDGLQRLVLNSFSLVTIFREDLDIDMVARNISADTRFDYSPDGTQFVYSGTVEGSPLQQVFIASIDDPEPQAITQLEEGSVQDVVWVAP